MPTRKLERERRFQLFGWMIFVVCSILFIVSGVATGSPWGVAGSIVFLMGCVIFLIPFIWKKG